MPQSKQRKPEASRKSEPKGLHVLKAPKKVAAQSETKPTAVQKARKPDPELVDMAHELVHSSYAHLYGYVKLELKKPPSKRSWRDIEKQAAVCEVWLGKFIRAVGLDKE